MIVRYLALLPLLAPLFEGTAQAETVEVHMLTRGDTGSMRFEPDHVELQPGDTLQFRATQRSHNAASIDGMVPAGFPGFKGRIDQEIAVTLDRPGIYGIKCSPHLGMGMVMLVRVGDVPIPAEAIADDLPARAKQRFAEIIDKISGSTSDD